MGITITDLQSEYGSYYNAGSQNEARLRKQLYYGFETANFFMPVPTDSTRYEMAKDDMSRVAQGFQTTWSPTGDITVEAVPIDTYRIKADVELTPDTIEESWLGFLASNDTDRKEWPLIRWLIENHILARFNHDLERNEIFHGQYSAASGGTPSAAGEAMTGFRKLINDAYAAEIPSANKIATGAIETDPTDFVDQIEAFCASMPELIKMQPLVKLAFRGSLKSRWLQGMRAKYNMNYSQFADGEIMRVADHPNVQVMPLHSFQSSEKIVASVATNAVMPVKDMQNVGNFQIESVDRTIKIFDDVRFGVGFTRWDQVCTNDRDLSNS